MIGTSTGEQYETDYDYTIGRPVGAATEPTGALKSEPLTPTTPIDQKAIDEMVAAAPNFANSSVIDQMSATADRSNPQLPITGVAQRLKSLESGGDWADSEIPEMLSNPDKFVNNAKDYQEMVKSWPKSTNIEDRRQEMATDANLRVKSDFLNLGEIPQAKSLKNLMTQPLNELERDIRTEVELKQLGKKRLREQGTPVKLMPSQDVPQTAGELAAEEAMYAIEKRQASPAYKNWTPEKHKAWEAEVNRQIERMKKDTEKWLKQFDKK